MAILYHWTGFPILTAASISDIIQYLSIMINKCLKVCQRLNSYKKKVEENRSDLDDPDAMLNYIQFFLGVAENYSNEIERLSSDLKSSVEKEHIISFQRLFSIFIFFESPKRFCPYIPKGTKGQSDLSNSLIIWCFCNENDVVPAHNQIKFF